MSLLPFLLFELICGVAGWGLESDVADPFIAFSTTRPLFERTEDGACWQITPSKRRFFSDEAFPGRKPQGTRRAFIIGESTVAGEPFGKPTAFPTWLQIALDATQPTEAWEIINCGGVSYASYRLAPILEECLTHQPDLIVLAVGHNEFLEERTYAPIRMWPAFVRGAYDVAERSRGFRVLRQSLLGQVSKPTLSDEVATRLDFDGGLAAYRRDDANRAAVVAHYEFNLRRMVRAARSAGVPLWLLRQPSNLADCPPFKTEYAATVSASDRQRCEALVNRARETLATDLHAAADYFAAATAVDPTFARTQYELGKCCEALGDRERARSAFLAARDYDVCPLRMTSDLERVLQAVATAEQTPLMDLHELLERESPTGILGGFLLVDHVHPSIRGHQLIARRLLQELCTTGFIPPAASDAATIEAAFAAHLQGLDERYYLRGQRTLRSLEAWAAGRAPQTPRHNEPAVNDRAP